MKIRIGSALSMGVWAVCVGLWLLATNAAHAEDWIVYGARARGMGGSGVAAVNGPSAGMWNPANLYYYYGAEDEEIIEEEKREYVRAHSSIIAELNAINVHLTSQRDVLVKADTIWKTVDWLINDGNYDPMATWLVDPGNNTMATDLSDELTAAAAIVANLGAMNQDGAGIAGIVSFGGDMSFDAFGGTVGLHIGLDTWTGMQPVIDLATLTLSGTTPEGLADGFAQIFGVGGTGNGGATFPFLPAPGSLNLDDGGTALATSLRTARPALNSTTGNGYNRADLLAYWFQISAAETGLNLNDPATILAITEIATNTGQSVFQSGQDPLENNQSRIRIRGVMLLQAGFSFAYPFIKEDKVSLSGGVTLRVLYARTFYQDIFLNDAENDVAELRDAVVDFFSLPTNENMKEYGNVTFDFGATLAFFNRRIRVSIVGKNITQPKFNFSGGGYFRMPAQYRIGGAADIVQGFLTVAGDLDLSVNKSYTMPGYQSRYFSFGGEITPFRYLFGNGEIVSGAARLGVTTNLADDVDDWLLTAGLGFKIWIFQLDIAAALSFQTLQTRNQADGSRPWADYGNSFGSIPREAGVNITLTVGTTW